MTGYALEIWICECSLFYKMEFLASKSAGAHSTKRLKISGCKRLYPNGLHVRAPAAAVLAHRLYEVTYSLSRSYLESRYELRRCVRTRAMCGRTCACACEIHSEKCVRCACVRLVFGRAMCDHTFAHFLEQNGQEVAFFCLKNCFRTSFSPLEHPFGFQTFFSALKCSILLEHLIKCWKFAENLL